jgi:hypothetical protein
MASSSTSLDLLTSSIPIIIVADTTSILSRWESSNLLNIHQRASHEGSEIFTEEPDILELSRLDIELAIENLKRNIQLRV